jgi:hypothetical protein
MRLAQLRDQLESVQKILKDVDLMLAITGMLTVMLAVVAGLGVRRVQDPAAIARLL